MGRPDEATDTASFSMARPKSSGPGALTLLLLVTLVATLSQTGCSPARKSTLRIGINAWPGYEFLYLAQEMGFYKDEGLEVRILEFNSLSDARRAYERGQLDAFGTTVIEVLQAREFSERSPQIVQIVDSSEGADVILAQPEVTDASGLEGKRVGVELGSVGIYILSRCLEKQGLTSRDVSLVSLDQMSMEEEFRARTIDAVVTYPPTSMNLLKAGKAHTVFTTAEIPGEVIDVIAADETLVKNDADRVAGMIRAYRRAVDYTSKNSENALRIMAARERLSPEDFAATLRDGIRLIPAAEQPEYLRDGGKLAPIINQTDRILRQAGQIKGPDRRATIPNDQFAQADDPS